MILLIIFLVSLIGLLWYKKDDKLPPGPFGFPIVGYYPFLRSNSLKKIQKLSEKYEPIMRINLLGRDFYFLNNFEAVNEALKKQSETFSGRSSNEFNLINIFHGKKGLQTTEGDEYKIQQKFYIGKLSGLGMGKSDFAIRIHELCDDLISYIKEDENSTELQGYLSNFTFNSISLLLLNEKYKTNDGFYKEFTDAYHRLNVSNTGLNLYLAGPLAYLLFRTNRDLWNKHFEAKNKVFEVMNNYLNIKIENKSNFECENILDYCIQQMNGPNADLFDKNNLAVNFILLFTAGSDTTASSLYLGINLMATHQNIQQRVYEEITETFGSNYKLLPTDIEQLNYTRAVIDEIQRFTCIVPFGLVHCNRESTKICGYNIPKRSRIIANIWKISRDKKYFKNPEVFDPNNFLDDNNNYLPNQALITFGIGKRKCLGKKLAEMEIMIAFSRLIQQFEWLPPKDEKISFKVNDALVRHLSPFKIIAKPRN